MQIANFANEALAQLRERSLPLPSSVLVHASFFTKYGIKASNIMGMAENDVLFVNPDAHVWADPVTFMAALHKAGALSTPHPLHMFYHEAGHLLQVSGERQKPLTPRQVTMASAVSDRARIDADEFSGEVFAGLMSGVQYDKDILSLYRRLGGKMP